MQSLRFRFERNKAVISSKCLAAAYEVIDYLKNNVHIYGIFRLPGREQQRHRILICMQRGDLSGLRHCLHGYAVEGAAALKAFIMLLPEPIFPSHIQQLIMADNSGVPEQVVAKDALGLLQQDVPKQHWELLLAVLGLLHVVATAEITNELQGCDLPVSLLPTFFHLKLEDLRRWKQVAAIFNELIIMAAFYPAG